MDRNDIEERDGIAPGPSTGPLAGVRVIEIASIGPGPFAAMMLADMGADVIRLDRGGKAASDHTGLGLVAGGRWNVMQRGRPSVGVDLRHPQGCELVLRLVESADALIEGFRPGVMERLGLGPDVALTRNPQLVYGRMTGYGQEGPMAQVAGHDINYLSLAGVLGSIARTGDRPLFPLNLLGDFGGGGMLMAFGITCGILEARASGLGQVVDAAMVDGVAVLSTMIHGLRAAGIWDGEPGANVLDSGAHFYEVYETADGRHLAVGAVEPQFYAELLRLVGIDPRELPQWERDQWPAMKERLAAALRTRTLAEWSDLLEHAEACATPVLTMDEAADHPHNAARGLFIEVDGVTQPAPSPRFSRTPPAVRRPAADRGADTDAALGTWGVSARELEALRAGGAIG